MHVGAIVGGLLGGIGGGDGGGGRAIGGVVNGRLVSLLLGWRGGTRRWGAVIFTEFTARVCQLGPFLVATTIPLGVLRLDRGRLLALGCGDAALDGEGGAVRAGHAQAGGVAAYLQKTGQSAIPLLVVA